MCVVRNGERPACLWLQYGRGNHGGHLERRASGVVGFWEGCPSRGGAGDPPLLGKEPRRALSVGTGPGLRAADDLERFGPGEIFPIGGITSQISFATAVADD